MVLVFLQGSQIYKKPCGKTPQGKGNFMKTGAGQSIHAAHTAARHGGVGRSRGRGIFRLIRELPDGYRTVFNLYVIEQKSHKEIAALLNIKESSSASQLHRAKAMLAARIRQYNNLIPTSI